MSLPEQLPEWFFNGVLGGAPRDDTLLDTLPFWMVPEKVKVKCPGCYGHGFVSTEQSVYMLDLTKEPAQKVG